MNYYNISSYWNGCWNIYLYEIEYIDLNYGIGVFIFVIINFNFVSFNFIN